MAEGPPVAVIVDIDDYRDMIQRLEDIEDLAVLDEMSLKPSRSTAWTSSSGTWRLASSTRPARVAGVSRQGLAWLLGIVLGVPAAYGFVALLSSVLLAVPFAFDPAALAWMLLFTLGVATLASVLPAWRAARVRLSETLRYE